MLPYSEADHGSPLRRGDFASMWRAVEAGYVAQPSDCPPVRQLGRHGYAVRCPGRVRVRRSETQRLEREFGHGWSAFGWGEYAGDPFPHSDSGLIASWVSGAMYFKIITGVKVLFSKDVLLYQGPVPNRSMVAERTLNAMAGLEFFNQKRALTVDGAEYCVASINFIAELPTGQQVIELDRGDLLGWFFPTLRATRNALIRLDGPESVAPS
jgi:hypothetical protein